ncbi:MAG: hypothetical protein WBY94_01540, partial [Polyangiaceae bacterium]
STRPINLTPQGINYDDCVADMVLSFNLVLSGFDGAENLQVWASKSSDCTQPADRGVQGSAAATCWPVAFEYWLTGPIYTEMILPFQVRVQDLVGLQNAPLTPPLTYQAQGPAACNSQSSFAAVPLTINFVPVDSNGSYAGIAYHFRQQTDLVGPPAPSGVSLVVGDTLLLATWSLNPDSDTSGYDVFIDPIPGHESMLSGIPDATSLVCPDTGAAASPEAEGGDSGDGSPSDTGNDTGDNGSAERGDDGSADAGVDADAGIPSAPADAGCYSVNVGGINGAAGTCSSVVLTSAIVQDSGVAVAIESLDDAGNLIDSGTSTTVSGGISTIPVANLVGSTNGGVTVPDRSTGSYTIRGLKNNITYNVAIAAVDAFGNIGPPSTENCNAPAPIADFWKIYRDDGGRTGGGLCSLETIGAQVPSPTGILLFGGSGALLIRRRSARRRSRRSALPRSHSTPLEVPAADGRNRR